MSSNDRPATLHYGPNGYRVISHGKHVVCAVTGEQIQLEALMYWCAERQEAYANAKVATSRLMAEG